MVRTRAAAAAETATTSLPSAGAAVRKRVRASSLAQRTLPPVKESSPLSDKDAKVDEVSTRVFVTPRALAAESRQVTFSTIVHEKIITPISPEGKDSVAEDIDSRLAEVTAPTKISLFPPGIQGFNAQLTEFYAYFSKRGITEENRDWYVCTLKNCEGAFQTLLKEIQAAQARVNGLTLSIVDQERLEWENERLKTWHETAQTTISDLKRAIHGSLFVRCYRLMAGIFCPSRSKG